MSQLYNFLLRLKKYVLLPFDLVLWGCAYFFSFAMIRNTFSLLGYEHVFVTTFLTYLGCGLAAFLLFRIYDQMWQYADFVEFLYVGITSVVGNIFFFVVSFFLHLNIGVRTYMMSAILSTFFLFMCRIVYKINKVVDAKFSKPEPKRTKRLLIVGGGEACAMILSELKRNVSNEFLPVCIVDDDLTKNRRSIQGIRVCGTTEDIPEVCRDYKVDAILFAIANLGKNDKKRILNICAQTGCEVNLIPDLYRVMTGQNVPMSSIRRVEVEDLLGRDPISLNLKDAAQYITGRTVMVTGGGGSIGSELCRQIAKYSPQRLVIVDIYENNAYDIQQELVGLYHDSLALAVEIASIRDFEKMDILFDRYRPDIVFHAAAHKHVPLMETSPEEAVKNNVFGTLNLVKLADSYHVHRFVQISTDKAVNPTNVMGATKRICEMIIQSMDAVSETEFVAVRFGNVLGSNGSVIPLFKKQIKAGGPVTVTHPDIIRYFMTIPEAVSLVLSAGAMARGGEIFVLDMGDPVPIRQLAENLIRLSGLKPGVDIQIEYTGLRPGEKLFEELLMDEEGIRETAHKKIYVVKPIELDVPTFYQELERLRTVAEDNDRRGVTEMVKKIVPTYTPKE